jgi:predicted negative regulator of RcsB-dependent stress response
MFMVVLLLVGIVGVGFYRGWIQFSAENVEQTTSATVTVDKNKIHADEQHAKQDIQDLGKAAKEKTGEWSNKAK